MMKYIFLLVALSLLPLAAAPKITNTNELIAAMQKKYGKSWYKTATFVQETTNFEPDGTSRSEPGTKRSQCPVVCPSDSRPTKKATVTCLRKAKFTVSKTEKFKIRHRSSIRFR